MSSALALGRMLLFGRPLMLPWFVLCALPVALLVLLFTSVGLAKPYFPAGFVVTIMAVIGYFVGAAAQEIQPSSLYWSTPGLASKLRASSFAVGVIALAVALPLCLALDSEPGLPTWFGTASLGAAACLLGTVLIDPMERRSRSLLHSGLLVGLLVLGLSLKPGAAEVWMTALLSPLLACPLALGRRYSRTTARRLGSSSHRVPRSMAGVAARDSSRGTRDPEDDAQREFRPVRDLQSWRRALAFETSRSTTMRLSARRIVIGFSSGIVLLATLLTLTNLDAVPFLSKSFLAEQAGVLSPALRSLVFPAMVILRWSILSFPRLSYIYPLSRQQQASVTLCHRRRALAAYVGVTFSAYAVLSFLPFLLAVDSPPPLSQSWDILRVAVLAWLAVTPTLVLLLPGGLEMGSRTGRQSARTAAFFLIDFLAFMVGILLFWQAVDRSASLMQQHGLAAEVALLLGLLMLTEGAVTIAVRRIYATADLA